MAIFYQTKYQYISDQREDLSKQMQPHNDWYGEANGFIDANYLFYT